MAPSPLGFGARLRSFGHALRGLGVLLGSQPNARVHAVATLVTCGLGVALGVERWEWCALLLAIALVWVAEALNTGLEFLCDAVKPEFHPLVEKAKDISAGGVLIAAFGAVAIGVAVFVPHLLRVLG